MRLAQLILALIALLMLSDFVLRGVALAFEPDKTDFSEVYVGAWLWRHGQDPYNSNAATIAQAQLVGPSVQIAPIYPISTFALLAPFTFLPYGWANLTWLLLGLGGIAATIFLLFRLHEPGLGRLAMMVLATFLLAFDPLHQAFHLGNVVLFVFPLALGAIVLSERGQDWWAGVILGICVALKPQIGIWLLLYYLLQRRKRIFYGALVALAAVAVILLLRPVPLLPTLSDYRANLHYWFAPGRPYGFTEGALAFHVNILQVIVYRLGHSVLAANLTAHALFIGGLALWITLLWRSRFRIPVPLAISSLLALSFVSLYHSVSDATILTLALCWAIPAEHEPWTRLRILTCAVFLLLMLPGHSALMRLTPHLDPALTSQWWWSLFVARYFVWLLLSLNVVLLVSLWDSARKIRAQEAL